VLSSTTLAQSARAFLFELRNEMTMNYVYYPCPACEEIKKFIEDRLFELRSKPRMSAEKKSLSHIENILHQFSEIEWFTYDTTTSSPDTTTYTRAAL